MKAHCQPQRGVKDTRGERTFLLRKPLGHRLDGRGKITRLAEAEHDAGKRKTRCRATQQHDRRRIDRYGWQLQPRKPIRQRMGHRSKAPDDHRNGKSPAHADAVHDPPRGQQPDRISRLKTEHDGGVGAFIEVKLILQGRLQNADDLAVDVVDRGCKKKQGANDPTIASRDDGSFHGSGVSDVGLATAVSRALNHGGAHCSQVLNR